MCVAQCTLNWCRLANSPNAKWKMENSSKAFMWAISAIIFINYLQLVIMISSSHKINFIAIHRFHHCNKLYDCWRWKLCLWTRKKKSRSMQKRNLTREGLINYYVSATWGLRFLTYFFHLSCVFLVSFFLLLAYSRFL